MFTATSKLEAPPRGHADVRDLLLIVSERKHVFHIATAEVTNVLEERALAALT